MLASRISYAKNCLITPGAYLANATFAAEDRQAQIPEFGNIYNLYCQRCRHNGAMDFDDLLLQTNILLRDCPDVLALYQEQFRYILVDEYQDTNYAQYVIIRRLSQHHSRVCVVGDDAQSIYSFRGAKIENILSFQKDYPRRGLQARTELPLDAHDRRCGQLGHRAQRAPHGEALLLGGCRGGEDPHPEGLHGPRGGRDGGLGPAREDPLDGRRLVRGGDPLPHEQPVGGPRGQPPAARHSPTASTRGSSFYDHKEIKDLLAYIRLVINPRDDEAFRRIVNCPARGIGDTTVGRIAQLAADQGVSMWGGGRCAGRRARGRRHAAHHRAQGLGVRGDDPRAVARTPRQKGLYDFGLEIASRSGLLAAYRAENTPEAASALDNIELLNMMQEFKERCDAEIRGGERKPEEEATIEEWLQQMMLQTDMDQEHPARTTR